MPEHADGIEHLGHVDVLFGRDLDESFLDDADGLTPALDPVLDPEPLPEALVDPDGQGLDIAVVNDGRPGEKRVADGLQVHPDRRLDGAARHHRVRRPLLVAERDGSRDEFVDVVHQPRHAVAKRSPGDIGGQCRWFQFLPPVTAFCQTL